MTERRPLPFPPTRGYGAATTRTETMNVKMRAAFAANPLAWLLLGLLALALCGSYRTGRDLQRLCELTGNHIVSVPQRLTRTPQQEIDNICLAHAPQEPQDD
jgi:hypothetical protein